MNEFCCYCGIGMDNLSKGVTYTKDHLVPKCKGGNKSKENKKPCCSTCNTEKGSRNLYQYVLYLKNRLLSLENYPIDYISTLDVLKKEIAFKIVNAENWIIYIENLGLKLYRNKEVYNQWRRSYMK